MRDFHIFRHIFLENGTFKRFFKRIFRFSSIFLMPPRNMAAKAGTPAAVGGATVPPKQVNISDVGVSREDAVSVLRNEDDGILCNFDSGLLK